MMLASTGDESILDSSDHIFEPKLDGFRALCTKKGEKISLTSRGGKNVTKDYPEFDFRKNIKADCVLDGEIVVYNQQGNPSFSLMQSRKDHGLRATFVVFDILEKDGENLRGRPLAERKKILAKTVGEGKNIQVMVYTEDGRALWKNVLARGMEGVVAKKKTSHYADSRSADWVKVKKELTADCVIVGYTTKNRAISSLALGLYQDRKLIYSGKVGTGFDDIMLKNLEGKLRRKKNDVHMPEDARNVIPVTPDLVCEIRYLQYTADARFRAPVFVRLRTDKKPKDCTTDQVQSDTALAEYIGKRDFSKTAEPGPRIASSKKPIYVIQKHNARRLHFDFRLEHNGVLKSWAVPKGPSENPADKRLAVMTEDHPLDYAKFHGTIPEGEYGAGTVEIWDTGRFVNITVKNGVVQDLGEAIEKGHFIVYVKGRKLNGTYAFTRMSGKNWILVKKREETKYEESSEVNIGSKKIELTNLDKELDKGILKGDLVSYYRKIAPLMLKHIEGRLISMYHFPDGVSGKKFFRKDMPHYFPKWMKSRFVQHEKSRVRYAIVDSEAGIIYLANQVVVPHIMASRADMLDRPDKIIFDLDPSETSETGLRKLKETAKKLRNLLDGIGFTSYIMTTGGKGYHVAVPVKRELDNSGVRDFALKIANVLVGSDPGNLTTELRKEKRQGKIFIDVNRISSMQTSVCPYAARPSPGLPIAAPFEWDELPNISPQYYTIKNPPKADAWSGFFRKAVSVKQVIKKMKKK